MPKAALIFYRMKTLKNGQFCKIENILNYGQKSVDFEAIWTLEFCHLSGATV